MIDYRILYKEEIPLTENYEVEYDLFISSFNLSDRVKYVYDKIAAKEKHWILVPDYDFGDNEYPKGNIYTYNEKSDEIYNESEIILDYIAKMFTSKHQNRNIKICIDVTGFIKPYIMFLIAYLKKIKIDFIDLIFSEPTLYSNKQNTTFSDEIVYKVRQVTGFEGYHNPDNSNDLLIIGSGYDDKLISFVAQAKNNTKKIQIFGYPSLRADMYQENILRASKAADSIGRKCGDSPNNYFSPANDPFSTAATIQKIINKENQQKKITNLYLSPLATKSQAIGFVLFYLAECQETSCSIIYPYCKSHAKKTSEGISRIWKYTIDFNYI